MRACSAVIVFLLASAYPDGPPPAHTGGFGEPTCTACHDDYDLDEGPGSLSVHGLPARLEPGTVYELQVFLRHEGMNRAGFELSSRFTDGTQAGRLAPFDEGTQLVTANGVEYVGHSDAGSHVRGDSIGWAVRWTTPESLHSEILIHAAANAANGDDSPFEDWVYAGAWTVTNP